MSTQKRNIWLDNVKGFLIICVVAGHFLESGIDYHSNMCKSLFLFIYSFHMPLFVFASGLMCEHAIKTKERFCKKLANFVKNEEQVLARCLDSVADLMDEDERREALEDAGLDPDDYDF